VACAAKERDEEYPDWCVVGSIERSHLPPHRQPPACCAHSAAHAHTDMPRARLPCIREKEMGIFNKRISAPNQLATLRELEGNVDVGKVSACQLMPAGCIVEGWSAHARSQNGQPPKFR